MTLIHKANGRTKTQWQTMGSRQNTIMKRLMSICGRTQKMGETLVNTKANGRTKAQWPTQIGVETMTMKRPTGTKGRTQLKMGETIFQDRQMGAPSVRGRGRGGSSPYNRPNDNNMWYRSANNTMYGQFVPQPQTMYNRPVRNDQNGKNRNMNANPHAHLQVPQPYYVERRGNNVRPKDYNGTTSWPDYLIQFQMISDLNGWNEGTRARNLAACLQGTALSVLGELHEHERGSWIAWCPR